MIDCRAAASAVRFPAEPPEVNRPSTSGPNPSTVPSHSSSRFSIAFETGPISYSAVPLLRTADTSSASAAEPIGALT